MSIYLTGSIDLQSSANNGQPTWDGEWLFTTQKEKGTFKFYYEWKSLEVSYDMYEKSSFMTSYDILKEKARHSKGRHRSKLTTTKPKPKSKQIINGTAEISSNEVTNEAVSGLEENETQIKSEDDPHAIDIDHGSVDPHEQGLEQSEHGNDETQEEVEKSEGDLSIPQNKETKYIDRKHPLFGVWEGRFEVIRDQALENQVFETFFIHSFIGMDSESHLESLPSEPAFSYSLLGLDEVKVRQFVLGMKPASRAEQSNEIGLPKSSEDNQGKDDPAQNTQEINPVPSDSKPSDFTLVWGFGMNSIGRFSIVGIHHSSGGKRARRYLFEEIKPPPPQNFLLSDYRLGSRPRNPPSTLLSSYIDSDKVTSHDFDYSHAAKKKKLGHGFKSLSDNRDDKSCNIDQDTQSNSDGDDNEEYRSAFYDEETHEIYEGGWSSGHRHGRGICLYQDGTMFEGMWSYGRENGKGQWMTGEREMIYLGDWVDGLMHGQGVYIFTNGDKYTGDFKEGFRHGRGDYLCSTGCRYVGEFKDNKRTGKGAFYWPDGSTYDGEWENDKRHGRGVLQLANGFKYDGSWVNNVPEGRGHCIFPSGQEYQGGFKQGMREGRGSVRFSEGAEYEGRFKDDRIDGQGTIKIANTIKGLNDDEYMIPIQIQADIKRIHIKAGFGEEILANTSH